MIDTRPVILCVEDNPDLRDDMATEIREAGYDVIEAADGQHAWQLLGSRPVDLVICDIALPIMSGLDLLALSGNGAEARTAPPFIMITAHSDEATRAAALELGAHACLTKPLDYGQLIDRLRNILERFRSAST